MLIEEWMPVKGYEGLYEISSKGNVKSVKRVGMKGGYLNGTIRTLKSNGTGYLFNTMYKDGKQKSKYIHRMVADAFIKNPLGLSEVNHIDGNKTNNNVNNLEWVTSSQNKIHAYNTGLRLLGDMHHKTKIKDSDVSFIINSKLSGVELSKMFNVHPTCISSIRNGKNRKRRTI